MATLSPNDHHEGTAGSVSIGRSISILLTATLVAVTGCSSDDAGDGEPAVGEEPAGTTEVERPDGPTADLSQELTGGDGVMLAQVRPFDLDEVGWVESEHVAAGTATSYRSDGALPGDGRFELTEDASADYRTRIVVRRPAEPDEFNGTVVVEWLNVSGGIDANPDFAYMAEELARSGSAWVGVSAQLIGVEGGPVAVGVGIGDDVAGEGLKGIDPERYGSLDHPGDAFSYDILTQVGRALRADGPGDVLNDLDVEQLLAVGESQAGFALTTYVNGVQPKTKQFDGFLVHSRGGAALPLGEPGESLDIAAAIGGEPVTIRSDAAVPVLVLETETDLLSVIGYYPARQPDSDHFRLWEVAGTAHADAYLVGPVADVVDCGEPINDGPHHFVVKAALRHLDTWARTGEAPPEAPRLDIDDTPAIQRDDDGIALGGIRTPQVDVPVATLSGDPGPDPSVVCLLLGSTTPLSDERLAELYDSPGEYSAAYQEAAEAAIDAGFVLADDREVLLADAEPDRIPQ